MTLRCISKCAPAVVSTLKGSLWKNGFFFSASWDMRVLRPALYRAYGSRLGHSGSTCGAWTGRIHRSTLRSLHEFTASVAL